MPTIELLGFLLIGFILGVYLPRRGRFVLWLLPAASIAIGLIGSLNVAPTYDTPLLPGLVGGVVAMIISLGEGLGSLVRRRRRKRDVGNQTVA